MYLFTTTFVALVVLIAASPMQNSIPTTNTARILSQSRKERLQEKIDAVGGCNANICFAIDGSGSIAAGEFTNEKNFVLDVVSVLTDNPVEFAATQYATSTNPIQALTADDETFISKVSRTRQVKGASFIAGGINYCFSQLFQRQGEVNQIVLLGDGRSNIGASAVQRADLFRSIGGVVSVVGAGFANDKVLLDIAGGNKDLVYEVKDFFDVLKLEIFIEQLVGDICSLS